MKAPVPTPRQKAKISDLDFTACPHLVCYIKADLSCHIFGLAHGYAE